MNFELKPHHLGAKGLWEIHIHSLRVNVFIKLKIIIGAISELLEGLFGIYNIFNTVPDLEPKLNK